MLDILIKLEQEFASEEAKLSEISSEHAMRIDELDQQITTFRRNEDVESLTKDDVYKFFNSMRPASSKKVSKKLSLPGDKLDKYFPLDMSQEERERVIFELLDKWRREKRDV